MARPLELLRGEAICLVGVRHLLADDDAALVPAEMATVCRDLSLAVARQSARCADPLLRRFSALLVKPKKMERKASKKMDPHGLRYAMLSARFFAHRKTHSDSHRSGACNMLCFCLDCSAAAGTRALCSCASRKATGTTTTSRSAAPPTTMSSRSLRAWRTAARAGRHWRRRP